MLSIPEWITAALALVGFLGAAAVFLRGSRDKGTIEALGKNNEALTQRVDILEAAKTRAETKIAALERENAVLRDVVTSADLIQALQVSLDTHHTEAMAQMSTLHEDLTDLMRAVTAWDTQ